MQRLPLQPSDPNYSFNTTIGEGDDTPKVYRFTIRWNAIDNAWYMDVRESDKTLIIAGIKIVCGTPLGRRSKHSLFSKGCFVAFDSSGKMVDPGFDDLGTRVKVIRLTNQEARELMLVNAS